MPALANITVTTLFSPWDDTQGAFLDFVRGTTESLYAVIYGFHLPALTDDLIRLHGSGVTVGIILDHTQAGGAAEASEVQRLVTASVPLLIGTSPVHAAIIHSKFAIRDRLDVESGSWNYSLSASQQSNTMTFISHADYAAAYLEHYHRLHAAVLLHDMAMQPAGAVLAPDIPAEVQATAVASAPVPARRRKSAA